MRRRTKVDFGGLYRFSLKKGEEGGKRKTGWIKTGSIAAKLDADSGSSCKPCNHISISVKRTLQNLMPVRSRPYVSNDSGWLQGYLIPTDASCSLFHNKIRRFYHKLDLDTTVQMGSHLIPEWIFDVFLHRIGQSPYLSVNFANFATLITADAHLVTESLTDPVIPFFFGFFRP